MESNVLQKRWVQGRNVVVDDLRGTAFTGENGAHTFRVIGVDSAQETVAITGTITGRFLTATNVTVPLTGSVSDGVASLTLTEDCYVIPGRFVLSIYATNGSTTQCIYCAVGNVFRTQSDIIEYPSASIPDIEQIIADAQAAVTQINADVAAAQAAVAAAQTAVDGIEDQRQTMIASIASVAGQGTDTTLTQSGVAADAKAAGDQISDLKSALLEQTNILPVENKSITINSVVTTFNNGTFTAVGTANANGGRGNKFAEMTLPAGTYTLTFHDVSIPSGTYNPVIYLMSGSSSALPAELNQNRPNTFTFDTDKNVFIGANFVSGRAYNFSAKIQLNSGSVPMDFMPTNGSAIDRAVRDNMYYVTPEMYGAVGNGMADDTVAIQRALDSGCGSIIFNNAKTYLVSIGSNGYALNIPSNIDIDLNHSTIKLNGNNLDTYGMLRAYEKSNISIRNGSIIGDADSHTGTSGEDGNCINIIKCNNVHLVDVEASKAWGDGLYIGSNNIQSNDSSVICNDVMVENCKFHDNGRNNVSVVACENFMFIGCSFSGAYRTGSKAGLDIEPNANTSDYVTGQIINCDFQNNPRSIDIIYTNNNGNSVSMQGCTVDSQCRFLAQYAGGHIDVDHLITTYASGVPIVITSVESAVNITNMVWYYNANADAERYLVQLLNSVDNAHVNADFYQLGNGRFGNMFIVSGSGTVTNFTAECRVHGLSYLNDNPLSVGYGDRTVAYFDIPLTLDGSVTLPSKGGSFIVDGISDNTTFPARFSKAQKGTKYTVYNKSSYNANIQGVKTVEPNHYTVFEALEYGVVVCTADYATA